MVPTTIVVQREARLSAVVESERPLRYAQAALADSPEIVRSGSALRWFGTELAVIQDDVNFIALTGAGSEIRAVALPCGVDGRRRFEAALGNKRHKLDLEAAIVHDGRLIAFGSGSTPARERLAILDRDGARLRDAAAFYAVLRTSEAFAGPGLNLEGAVVLDSQLILLQRGNGAAQGGVAPVNALIAFELSRFLSWLDAGSAVPEPVWLRSYDLGREADVAYGFTDAEALADGRIVYVAAAERSPNPVDDGENLGAALGILSGSSGRFCRVCGPGGAPWQTKIEGLARDAVDPELFWAVTDTDDPERATQLCGIRVSGL